MANARANRRVREILARHRGVTLVELLVVLAILALLAVFVTQCTNTGGSSASGVAGSATISAARETIKVAAKNLLIASAPVSDCNKATALAADIAAAQAKIDDAARDYPQDYAANKAAIQQDIDKVNQQIALYNHDCSASIPLLTLP